MVVRFGIFLLVVCLWVQSCTWNFVFSVCDNNVVAVIRSDEGWQGMLFFFHRVSQWLWDWIWRHCWVFPLWIALISLGEVLEWGTERISVMPGDFEFECDWFWGNGVLLECCNQCYKVSRGLIELLSVYLCICCLHPMATMSHGPGVDEVHVMHHWLNI